MKRLHFIPYRYVKNNVSLTYTETHTKKRLNKQLDAGFCELKVQVII